MFDRASFVGMGGTLATFGLSALDTVVGIAVGLVTLAYMSLKLYQELRKKK
jgi:Na+(H+)/acetate symporter ActP